MISISVWFWECVRVCFCERINLFELMWSPVDKDYSEVTVKNTSRCHKKFWNFIKCWKRIHWLDEGVISRKLIRRNWCICGRYVCLAKIHRVWYSTDRNRKSIVIFLWRKIFGYFCITFINKCPTKAF